MFGFKRKIPEKDLMPRNENQSRIKTFFELLYRKCNLLCKLNLFYLLLGLPAFVLMMIAMGSISGYIMDTALPLMQQAMGYASLSEASPEFLAFVITTDALIRFVLTMTFFALFGIGPVTAGVTYVLKNYVREEHSWAVSDLLEKAKENLKQGLILFVIDFLFFFVVTNAFLFYLRLDGLGEVFAYIVFCVFVIYSIMHFYIYHIMITFELPLKTILKNAFYFTFIYAPKNLLLFGASIFMQLGLPLIGVWMQWSATSWLIYIGLEIILTVAALGFMVSFVVYPEIEKYVKIAKENESPKQENE